jgi:predicted nucleic acid-binding protein
VAVEKYLIDKSAAGRIGNPEVAWRWRDRILAGHIAMCPVLEIEWLYSARSVAEYKQWSEKLRGAFTWFPVPDGVWTRVLDVQQALAEVGKHRGPSIADMLLAATAEAHRLTVLHYDADFDTIAEITGQPTEWIAERGSI